jgi:hypothetical protein
MSERVAVKEVAECSETSDQTSLYKKGKSGELLALIGSDRRVP